MRCVCGLLFLLAVFPALSRGQEAVQPSADWVEFDGNKLYFAFKGGNPGESFKEYIPAGENLQSWTKLASVREYVIDAKPLQFARSMVELIKADNPAAQAAIVHNPKTDAVVLDFITWQGDLSFTEFNVFKFHKTGPHRLISHQYAVRAYSNQREFMLGLTDFRRRMQEEMVVDGMKVSPPATARR